MHRSLLGFSDRKLRSSRSSTTDPKDEENASPEQEKPRSRKHSARDDFKELDTPRRHKLAHPTIERPKAPRVKTANRQSVRTKSLDKPVDALEKNDTYTCTECNAAEQKPVIAHEQKLLNFSGGNALVNDLKNALASRIGTIAKNKDSVTTNASSAPVNTYNSNTATKVVVKPEIVTKATNIGPKRIVDEDKGVIFGVKLRPVKRFSDLANNDASKSQTLILSPPTPSTSTSAVIQKQSNSDISPFKVSLRPVGGSSQSLLQSKPSMNTSLYSLPNKSVQSLSSLASPTISNYQSQMSMSADLLTPKSPYSNTADQSNSIGSIFKVPKLQPTAERIYLKQPLLLVLKGKRRLMARSVKLEVSSLNQTDTFLLDLPINNTPSSSLNKTIRKLFVVSGQHTPMVSRARAIELANRIKDCDYSGKAEIELIELGGLKSRYIMNREIPFWACLIGDYENINAAVKASIDLTATNGVKDDLQFEEMELEQLELFEFPGSRLIAKRDLKRSMLKSDSVYVLCSNSEAFIWSGRQSDKSHKESALQFVAGKASIVSFEETEKFEREIFKLNFSDWKEEPKSVNNILTVKPQTNIKPKDKEWRVYDRGSDNLHKTSNTTNTIDIVAMISNNSNTNAVSRNTEQSEVDPETLVDRDWGFVSLKVWRIHDLAQNNLSIDENLLNSIQYNYDSQLPLMLYSNDCYLMWYEFKERPLQLTDGVLMDRLANKITKEELDATLHRQSVLYIWIGGDSKATDQTVAAHLAVSLEKIIVKASSARQIRVLEGKEPVHFMNVIRGGNRPPRLPERLLDMLDFAFRPPCPVFVVKHNDYCSNAIFKVCGVNEQQVQIVQQPSTDFAVTSTASFVVLTSASTALVWHGSATFSWEQKAAVDFAEITAGSVIQLNEGSGDGEFWKFANRKLYNSCPYYRHRPLIDSSAYRLRLWRIKSNKAQEISPFIQSDLSEDDVYLLDSWFQLFVWVGSKVARTQQITLIDNAGGAASTFKDLRVALETANAYADHVRVKENGRLDSLKTCLIQSGSESPEFISQFIKWKNHASEEQTWPSNISVKQALDIINGSRYSLKQLKQWSQSRKNLPFGVDLERLEDYLNDDEFMRLFALSRQDYQKLPRWKQIEIKKKTELF